MIQHLVFRLDIPRACNSAEIQPSFFALWGTVVELGTVLRAARGGQAFIRVAKGKKKRKFLLHEDVFV